MGSCETGPQRGGDTGTGREAHSGQTQASAGLCLLLALGSRCTCDQGLGLTGLGPTGVVRVAGGILQLVPPPVLVPRAATPPSAAPDQGTYLLREPRLRGSARGPPLPAVPCLCWELWCPALGLPSVLPGKRDPHPMGTPFSSTHWPLVTFSQ